MRLTDERAISYIQEQLKSGYTKQQVIDAMTARGYDEDAVRQTIKHLETNQQAITPGNEQPDFGPVPDGRVSAGWYLFKLCWRVIMKDKELLVFTALSALLTAALFGALAATMGINYLNTLQIDLALLRPRAYLELFAIYLAFALISTYFQTAIVHVVKTRLQGGSPTFASGLGFASKRAHRVLQWSILAATIGVLLRLLEALARRAKGLGKILLGLLRGLLGLTWNIISIFAVPAMVIYDENPFKALKHSAQTIKKRWGEALVSGIALGVVEFAFWALIIIGWTGAVILAIHLNYTGVTDALLWPLIAVCAFFGLLLIATIFVFQTAKAVWRTAVFLYAADGTIAQAFPEELLQGAFTKK